jgi:hypothetical protein
MAERIAGIYLWTSMDASEELDRRSPKNALIRSRGFALILVLLSAWSLYASVRNASARFHVPHNLVMHHALSGRPGWAMDLFVYLGVTFVLVGFVSSTRDKVEMALFIGGIGPIVINPARMLVPKYTSAIWWVELCLTFVFFVTSVIVFSRLIRRRSMPGELPNSDQVS